MRDEHDDVGRGAGLHTIAGHATRAFARRQSRVHRRDERRARPTSLAFGVATLLGLAPVGCNTRTRNDVYSEALAARHHAKTVECKLVYDPEKGGNLLSGRDVARCLDANKKALELFEEAKRVGMDGRAFEIDLDVQREDVKQLEDMLIMVRRMEVDAPISEPTP